MPKKLDDPLDANLFKDNFASDMTISILDPRLDESAFDQNHRYSNHRLSNEELKPIKRNKQFSSKPIISGDMFLPNNENFVGVNRT